MSVPFPQTLIEWMWNPLNSSNEELFVELYPRGIRNMWTWIRNKKIIVQFHQINYDAQRRISTLEVCFWIEIGFQSTEVIIKAGMNFPLSLFLWLSPRRGCLGKKKNRPERGHEWRKRKGYFWIYIRIPLDLSNKLNRFFFNMYLFGCTGSSLQHTGNLISITAGSLLAACGV